MEATPRVLTLSAIAVCAGVMALASCTRTTDRVVEPVGGGDASTSSPTSPALGDASVGPIGPLALPPPNEQGETGEDFRLVRAPEFGSTRDTAPQVVHVTTANEQSPGLGGNGGNAGNGIGGNDRRPVSSGGGRN